MKLLSIGEILWDVLPAGKRLGGAPYNLAAQARKLGHDVVLMSAVGDDDLGRGALELASVPTDYIAVVTDAPTGTVTVALDAEGQPAFTIHRPAAYDYIPPMTLEFEPDWICFGTLLQMTPAMRQLVAETIKAYPRARRFYDVNLRPGNYTPELVQDLMRLATVVKLNEDEERTFGPQSWEMACITRGAAGCTIVMDGARYDCPGYPVKSANTVGAGDAFSAAFLHGLEQGWPPERIGDFANRIAARVVTGTT